MIRENEFASFMLLAILISAVVIGLWRFDLRPVRFYDSDGSSLWKHKMSFIEKRSFWPATTHYSVRRNGISASIDNEEIASNSWVEFALWNSQGINSIEVRGVDTDSLLYPTPVDVRSIYPGDGGLSVNFGNTTTLGGRYRIIGVKPKIEETRLRIIVVDVKGNVTQDTVSMGEIM